MTHLKNVLSRTIMLSLVVCCLSLFHSSKSARQIPTSGKADAGYQSEPRNLSAGEKVSDALSAGEVRTYTLSLSAGQHVNLELKKGDAQLIASICDPQKQRCLNMLGRRFGSLHLPVSTNVATIYQLEVKSIETDVTERSYELLVSEIGPITPRIRAKEEAVRAIAEADELREQHLESAQLKALAKYNEAIGLWKSSDEPQKAAETFCLMGDVYFALSQYQKALAQYAKALAISEARKDEAGILAALNGLGYTHIYLSENQKATSYAKYMQEIIERADPAKRSANHRRAEAQAINILGEVDYALGQLRYSIGSFERAHAIYAEVGDRSGQALCLLNLGYSNSDLGNAQKASECFEGSLKLFQSINDGRGAALAQTVLGGTHSLLGEEQIALTLHQKAGDYFRAIGNEQGEAAALNGVARAYQNLNEYDAALDNFNRALRLNEEIGNRGFVALGKFLIGRVYYLKKEAAKARVFYQQSFDQSRAVGNSVVEAHATKGLGTIAFAHGDVGSALARFDAALDIYRKLGNRRSEAYVLNDIGHIQTVSQRLPEALTNFQQALVLMRNTGDRHGEALTLFNTARAQRQRGNLTTALSLIEDSIAIGEALRTKVNNSQLRTSYFASVHQQFELYIDILMSLHNQFPDRGYNVTGLLASERARARSLLDSLQAEKIEFRDVQARDLLSRQLDLSRRIDQKAEFHTRLLTGNHTKEEADKLSQEINALTLEYQDVRSRLKIQSPRRAFLTQTDQLRAEDLQSIVKADDALLLEFALGEDKSYLWMVSGSGISSYELPGRSVIQTLSMKVYDSLTIRQSLSEDLDPTQRNKKITDAANEFREHSAVLSQMLFGQVASKMGNKPLLIVGDGTLRYVPFEALPLPGLSSIQPLVSAHEIVMLPSATTLLALRSDRSQRGPRYKTIAIIADPVFEKDDPRVLAPNSGSEETRNGDLYLSTAMRDFGTSDRGHIPRLPSTLGEAMAIMKFVPGGNGTLSTGFEATKQKFVSDGLREYRILHVATHGLLNVEHPDLSGVLLTMVDEQGQNINGFVRMHDIYSLDLSADLVVLSACRTGLGKDVHGEGMVGLPSGFMYAGAKSVVASLWKVDDHATADFMTYFYAAMLRDGLPPASALRMAKLEMQKQPQWREPFFWAGFILQGEYRKEPEPHQFNWKVLLLVTGVILLVATGVHLAARYKMRRKA